MNLAGVRPLRLIASASIVLAIASAAQARRVSIDGVGVAIRAADKSYQYKDDHLDTTSFNGGLIFPNKPLPDGVTKDMEYATHDFRPTSEDPRVDHIDRVKVDEAGKLMIAMPTPTVRGNGWSRVSKSDAPDFKLARAQRNGSTKPDDDSPYWYYEYADVRPNVWIDLPKPANQTDRPPFVFAQKGELYWENAPKFDQAGAVVIVEKRDSATTLANPSLLVMPDGSYLASITWGDTPGGQTGIYKSTDKGKTWTVLKDGFTINRHSLFTHKGGIYLLGMNTRGDGDTRIYGSTDGGKTWSTNAWDGLGGEDAPSQVAVAHGRIWKAAYVKTPKGNGAPGFYSAPVDADLMKAESWTRSAPDDASTLRFGQTTKLANGQTFKPGNEGTLIAIKDVALYNLGRDQVTRPGSDGTKPGLSPIQPDLSDLQKTTVDPSATAPLLPGNQNGKCTAIYDAKSNKVWAMTSGTWRRTCDLYSADVDAQGRIGDFAFRKTILTGDSFNDGFNYPFVQIDGDDLIFVSRTSWSTSRGVATRWHNGNLFTFHRVPNFRSLTTTPTAAAPAAKDAPAEEATAEDATAPAAVTAAAKPWEPEIRRYKDGSVNPNFMRLHESFIARGKAGPIGLLLLGDSITAHWRDDGNIDLFNSAFGPYQPANFGIAGDKTQNVLWRIANGEFDAVRPRVVMLMIGTNNLAGSTDAEIVRGVQTVIDAVHEKTRESTILLLGIFPRSADAKSPRTVALRKRIESINDELKRMAERPYVRYLDIGGAFLEADGSIRKEVMSDGLHPAREGYEKWAAAVRQTLEDLWAAPAAQARRDR